MSEDLNPYNTNPGTASKEREILSHDHYLLYDGSLTWREAKYRFKRWYLKKRLKAEPNQTILAKALGIERTHLCRVIKELMLKGLPCQQQSEKQTTDTESRPQAE